MYIVFLYHDLFVNKFLVFSHKSNLFVRLYMYQHGLTMIDPIYNIDRLEILFDNDKEVMSAIVRQFADDVQSINNSLRNAYFKADLDEQARELHKLKSPVRNFELQYAAVIIGKLEEMTEKGDQGEAYQRLLDELQQQLLTVIALLSKKYN